MYGFNPSESLASLLLQVLLLTGDDDHGNNTSNITGSNNKLSLISSHQDALTQFTANVVKDIPSAYEYLKTDTYLIKWLRGSDFNVEEATKSFLEELQWREDNQMDVILNEDLSDLEFVYSLDQTDSEGHPILLIPLALWDLRKAVVSGKGKRFERFVFRMLLDVDSKLRQLQAEGKDISKFVAVVNMQGFNMIQHACVRCVPYYTSLLMAFEKHFPESMHRAVFVNTPAVFEFILTAMRSVMTQAFKDVFEVYGSNRKAWDPSIAQIIETGDNDSYEDY